MEVVSAREFRASQTVRPTEDNSLTNRISRSLKEVKLIREGKAKG